MITNGHEHGVPDTTAQATQASAMLDNAIRTSMMTTLRGMLACAPNFPPHVVMTCAAYHLGYQMAAAFTADLSAHLQVRKALQEAFAQGIKNAKMTQPPPPQGVNLGARQ